MPYNIYNFHMYLPGYDVEQIGYYNTDIDLDDLDIKHVQYPGNVRIGNQTYELKKHFGD